MRKLNVELYGTVLGKLTLQKGRFLNFETTRSAFESFGISSTIMSLAVPLNLKYTNKQKKRTENFFAELLPEGRNLEWLSQSVAPGERNLYGLLSRYGKDIAGALTIYDPDEASSNERPEARRVTGGEIRYLMEHMPQAALGNAPVSGRTSLGGLQGKIVLAKLGEGWYRVHNGYPSTHILKPVIPEYPTMIYDEAFCMSAAQSCGLTACSVEIETFDGADALVIERYDRVYKKAGNNAAALRTYGDSHFEIEYDRVHQEDFNQVLGAHGSEKYQEYGGKVSAKRIAQTLEQYGRDDDVTGYAAQLIFAAAIGNLDMHAKNVSILHFKDETIALAPTYDQVPLRHQSTESKMALSINGKYNHGEITLNDIAAELLSWQCSTFSDEAGAVSFTENRLKTFMDAFSNTAHVDKSYPMLKEEILLFITNLLSGKNIDANYN